MAEHTSLLIMVCDYAQHTMSLVHVYARMLAKVNPAVPEGYMTDH